MSNLTERLVAYMPQYPKHKMKRFLVQAIPQPWYRKLKILPYFVGQRVEFRLKFIDNDPEGAPYKLYLWESFGSSEPVLTQLLRPTEKTLVGQNISNEGDIVYKLGIMAWNQPPDESIAFTIVSGKAKNTDDFLPYIIGGVLAVLLQVIAGIILELINVRNSIWEVWMPDFIVEWLRSAFK